MRKRLTIHDLMAAKGKRQLTEIFTVDGDEARACDAAGIDMIVTGAHAVRRCTRRPPPRAERRTTSRSLASRPFAISAARASHARTWALGSF